MFICLLVCAMLVGLSSNTYAHTLLYMSATMFTSFFVLTLVISFTLMIFDLRESRKEFTLL